MEPRFGVIAGGTARPLQIQKLHLKNLTYTRMHQDGRNIQFLSTEWHVQKAVKMMLDLSKLTLFGIGDRTNSS